MPRVRIFQIDPTRDPRWNSFIEAHPSASVFHTPGWLLALQHAYAYRPIAFVDAAPGQEISSGQVFCSVDSWLTGKRFVSLPFSDHAANLLETADDTRSVLEALRLRVDRREIRYAEIRPTRDHDLESTGFVKGTGFMTHSLALNQDLATIFRNFHKSCVQRKIRRAERENLTYVEGKGTALLGSFYRLLLITNKRRGTPPQPLGWFHNVAEHMGDRMKIRIAAKEGRPIAAILTLTFKKTITYKYGCSDERFHRLGGMPFLFWKTIQDAKESGMELFDFGRSDLGDVGLVTFKEHFGAKRNFLNYWRYPGNTMLWHGGREFRAVSSLLCHAPTGALKAVGSFLYRHMA